MALIKQLLRMKEWMWSFFVMQAPYVTSSLCLHEIKNSLLVQLFFCPVGSSPDTHFQSESDPCEPFKLSKKKTSTVQLFVSIFLSS